MSEDQSEIQTQRNEPLSRRCLFTLLRTGTAVATTALFVGFHVAETEEAAKAASRMFSTPPAAPPPTQAGTVLARTTDIPVGSGRVFGSAQVVITQSALGQFQAFSSICTHQGCSVSKVEKGAIICPCHGSKFDATTGAVLAGPAPAPLASVSIRVNADGTITLA
ncbi:MAG TPA: Rieske (2Fe-2S) protein [Ktedonosporobacter sp.]|nr:Rieske (2Fe-2S) protein [Ktedonosporobacter sp.]